MTLPLRSHLGRLLGYDLGRPVYGVKCCAGTLGNVPLGRHLGRLLGYDLGRPVYALGCCFTEPETGGLSAQLLGRLLGYDLGRPVYGFAQPCCAGGSGAGSGSGSGAAGGGGGGGDDDGGGDGGSGSGSGSGAETGSGSGSGSGAGGCAALGTQPLHATMIRNDVVPCLEGVTVELPFRGYWDGTCQEWGGVIEDACTAVIYYVCVRCTGAACGGVEDSLSGNAVLGIAPPNPLAICNIGPPGPIGNQFMPFPPVNLELYEDNSGFITQILVTE